MEPLTKVLLFVVGLSLAYLVVRTLFRWQYSKDAWKRRELKSAQRVPIRKVADGTTVKIGGRLSYAGDPLEAPLSGRACACWQVVIERQVRSGNSCEWEELIRDQEARSFFVEDETGRALVEARNPAVALNQDAHFSSGTFNDATERLEAFLASHGKTSVGLLGFNIDMRYREGVLEEGEVVSAWGRARLEPDPDGATSAGGYREAPTRVVIGDPDVGQMLLSDDPDTAS